MFWGGDACVCMGKECHEFQNTLSARLIWRSLAFELYISRIGREFVACCEFGFAGMGKQAEQSVFVVAIHSNIALTTSLMSGFFSCEGV